MDDEYRRKGKDLVRPDERVLLVVDEDNAYYSVQRHYNLSIDWRAFRHIVPVACTQFQEGPRCFHIYTPVAPVQRAHLFRTVFRKPGETWAEYRGRCRWMAAALRKDGYVPHLMRPRRTYEPDGSYAARDLEINLDHWNVPAPVGDGTALGDRQLGYRYGYSDRVVMDCIEENQPDYDTLILVSGDADFSAHLADWHRDRLRAFFVASPYSISRWRRNDRPRFVDLGRTLTFYTQVIRPLPWRLSSPRYPLPARPAA